VRSQRKVDEMNRHVAASLEASQRSYRLYGLSMQVFQANAQRGDFEAAEAERPKLQGLLDDYLDQFMAANKRLLAG
jgi:hypothetical protein